ncbi:MAG: 4-alpha-glucanotransferase, partial [Acidimicrobiales bacterium]|nr:4-alpha-glucanotransferase [Acidimicrobiales bacterium]
DRDAEVLRIHEMVSASPADLACVTLDDLAATPLRPNMPGTIDEWPNWRIPLPTPIGEILASDRATRLRDAMATRTPPHDGAGA